MRKNLLFLCVLFALQSLAQPLLTLDEVNDSWTTRSLKVTQKKVGIMQLVETFNKAYPTYSVTEFLKDARRPEAEQKWIITIDRPNGFVSFAEGSDDAASEEMNACVWKRANGHRLFAIAFMMRASRVGAFVAFFDYNPATRVLKPESDLAIRKLFTPTLPGAIVSIHLPQHGKDMVVSEYDIQAGQGAKHIYKWDGMKPVPTD